MGFWNTAGRAIKGIVTGKGITPSVGGRKFEKKFKNAYEGTPEERQNVSLLTPRQQSIQRDVTRAAKRRGAPGTIGQSADIYRDMNKSEAANLYRDMPQNEAGEYYRSNLSNNPADFEAFAKPEMRNFSENIAPGIAEQYAGMGAGGNNGGFANSMGQAGVDLSERLGAIRANLRQNSAQGLQNMYMQSAQGLHGINSERAQGLQGISNAALGQHTQNMVTRQGTEGFGSKLPGIMTGAATAYLSGGNPGATMAGYEAGNQLFGKGGNKVGANTSEYGSGWSPQASPKLPQRTSWTGA